MESIESTERPFTLLIDWLAFTLPDASEHEVRQLVGGDWVETDGGFRGYPRCWLLADGSAGVGKLGTGAPRRPREVHVDLSGGIVSTWDFDKVRTVLRWVLGRQGKCKRIDCALDDRKALVPLAEIKAAINAGQVVTRADCFKEICNKSLRRQGVSTGSTLYIGSPTSKTQLRIYDKRLELQHKKRPNWSDYGIRWELELREERAHACAQTLAYIDEVDWHEFTVSILRAHVDFRDTSPNEPSWVRCQAALLPWWEALTEGFRKGRLVIEKNRRSIEDAKNWVSRSLAPMLAVMAASSLAGEQWLRDVIAAGADRWKDKHYQLLKSRKPMKPYQLKPRSSP